MRTNGTVRLLPQASDPALDESGEPLAEAERWSEELPCFATPHRDERAQGQDGARLLDSYVVRIEGRVTPDQARRLRLTLHDLGTTADKAVRSVLYVASADRTDLTTE